MQIFSIRQKDYRQILLSFAIVAFLTVGILTVALYANYSRVAAELVQNYTKEELSQVSHSTDTLFETSKSSLMQYASHPSVLQLMNYDTLDSPQRAALLQQVSSTFAQVPYANSFYIYNRVAGKIYYNSLEYAVADFPDQDIIKRLNDTSSPKLRPIARKVPSASNFGGSTTPDPTQTEEDYSFIYYDNTPDRSVVLNVSSQWVKETIDSMSESVGKEIVILDAQGNVVLGNQTYKYLQNVSDAPLFSSIFHHSQTLGSSVQTVGGQKYLVSYVTSALHGWIYIRLTPYNAIQGKISQVMVTTLLLAVLVLFGAMCIALLFARSVYGFFTQRISALNKRWAAQKDAGYDKRQEFLQHFFENSENHELRVAEFEKFGVQFTPGSGFFLLLFQIDRYEAYCRAYPPEDRSLFAYGMVNIANELVKLPVAAETVHMNGGRFALLMGGEQRDFENAGQSLRELAAAVQEKAKEYLSFTVSVVIGEYVSEYSEIPAAYNDCCGAMDYKIFSGPGAVLTVGETKEIQKREFQVPVHRVEALVDHLLLGKQQETHGDFDEIVEGMRGYSFAGLQLTMVQLGLAIINALEKQDILPHIQSDVFFETAARIPSMETLDELKQAYYALFDKILTGVWEMENQQKQGKSEQLQARVEQFVQQEYNNPALNSDLIARQFGISADYLRRQYKKAAGHSVNDYINSFRISLARERLKNTDDPVSSIALQTGFVNVSYFYTAFKKACDLTPGEFRSLSRKGA